MKNQRLHQLISSLYNKEIAEDIVEMVELHQYLDSMEVHESYDKWDDWHKDWDNIQESIKDAEAQLEADYENRIYPIIFVEDYDNAILEAMGVPSDRELYILKLARKAADHNIGIPTIAKFFRIYNLNCIEQQVFYNEYWSTIG